MTTETEKEFFKAFGIEPKPNESGYGICKKYDYLYKCKSDKRNLLDGCVQCKHFEITKFYPDITDRILLELICILTKVHPEMDCCCFLSTCENVEQLKELALEDCLEYSEHIYIAVRKLFGVE